MSTGAQNDLEKITQMAYSTVAVYGMNERVGLVSFPPDKQRMDKPYSDDTARLIDQEVREVVSTCYDRTLELLREKRDAVEALAQVRPGCAGRCRLCRAADECVAIGIHANDTCSFSRHQHVHSPFLCIAVVPVISRQRRSNPRGAVVPT